MRACWLASLLLLSTWLGVASAQAPPTTLRGRVTDVLGRPVAGARVHVLARSGARVEGETARDGRYSVDVPRGGAYGVVIAVDDVHTYRTVLLEPHKATTLDVEAHVDTKGGEVIDIVDHKPKQPKVAAKSKAPPRQALPYSEEAVERDAWARAWLLLDVDATGRVTRLKLLKAPGFDLDRIAIEQGLALRFDPARDEAGRAVRTYVVYSMEWPSWGWVIQGNGVALRPNDADAMHGWAKTTGETRLPESTVPVGEDAGFNIGRAYWAAPPAVSFSHSLERVPCAGSGPLNLDARNRAYRDCSTYDLSAVDALPWITKATVDTAVADLQLKRMQIVEVPAGPRSRVPEIIATGVTGAMVAGMVVAHFKFRAWNDETIALTTRSGVHPDEINEAIRQRTRWSSYRVVLAIGSVFAGGTAAFLWTRDAPTRSFSVQPTNGGAAASFSMSF